MSRAGPDGPLQSRNGGGAGILPSADAGPDFFSAGLRAAAAREDRPADHEATPPLRPFLGLPIPAGPEDPEAAA
jgi:hypothetical protein